MVSWRFLVTSDNGPVNVVVGMDANYRDVRLIKAGLTLRPSAGTDTIALNAPNTEFTLVYPASLTALSPRFTLDIRP